MYANSTPMAPEPPMMIDFGRFGSMICSSYVTMFWPFGTTPGTERTVAPVAMIRLSKVCSVLAPSFATEIEVGEVRVPQPSISVILFFFIRKCTPLTMPADTARERSQVGPYDMVASPSMPYLAFSWLSVCASSAFFSSALDGMQPTLRQTPPQYLSSTTATDLPSWAARMAAT